MSVYRRKEVIGNATLYLGDCLEILPTLPKVDAVITDPPYNVGFKYESYSDVIPEGEYVSLIATAVTRPCVVVQYPEQTINVLPRALGLCNEVVSWVYSSPIPKQHRLISWWGIKPDFSLDTEPYPQATLRDARASNKLKDGRSLKDWWEIQYIKFPNLEKTGHPCQMPIEVMKRVVKVTAADTILDPFMGSGTTGVACMNLGRRFIGIEIEPKYFDIACERIENAQRQVKLFDDIPTKPEQMTL